MHRTRFLIPRFFWLAIGLAAAVALVGELGVAAEQQSAKFAGRPLAYWTDQATSADGPNDVAATVAALTQAVRSDDPNAKRDAADALAVLGPKAKAALPALLEQFGHEYPWVRVSCQAAAGAIGKDAVPALIKVLETQEGGPRIRAAFVLGGIGPDAQAAVPALLRIMKDESSVMQTRLRGVLGQIDPQRFGHSHAGGTARFDEAAAGSGKPESGAGNLRDWPQFHGPNRDSICREHGLLQTWPDGGPRQLWTLGGLGRGYSTVAIAAGTIYTMGDLSDDTGDEHQCVLAFNLVNRQLKWSTPIGPPHADGGPRCTPTVDGQRLYVLGTDGDLACLDVASGQIVWARNIVNDYQAKYMGVWKFSESPLVDGDRVICTPGGPAATMVALDKTTGKELWRCVVPDLGPKGVDGCGYSSAVVATIGEVRQYVQLIGRGVVGVDAATGKYLWGYNAVANTVANIPTPIVRGDYVFATTAYSTGAALLKISTAGVQFRADEVYFINPRDFQNHHGGVVLSGNYIYGGHGPNRSDPACIDFRTGKVVWKERAPARGSAGVLYADGNLIFRYDRGEVLLIGATPAGMQIKGRFKTPAEEGPAWAHPVIHDGKLYLRHADSLFCYDLRG